MRVVFTASFVSVDIYVGDYPPPPEPDQTYQTAYGTAREDTKEICGDIDNGFGLLFNWNRLGPGTHRVLARADGEVFGSATVTVTTLGQEFWKEPVAILSLRIFRRMEVTSPLVGNSLLQNFVIQGDMRSSGGTSGAPPHVLENPPPGSFQSGVGVISGWVCEAEQIDIVFNPGTDTEMTFQAGYGPTAKTLRGFVTTSTTALACSSTGIGWATASIRFKPRPTVK